MGERGVSNPQPLDPQSSALFKARLTPMCQWCVSKCLNLPNYGYGCLKENLAFSGKNLVRLTGLEPATQGLEIPCSIFK